MGVFGEFIFFGFDVVDNGFVLKEGNLLLFPEDGIIDILGEVAD